MIGCINMNLPEIRLLKQQSGLEAETFDYLVRGYMSLHDGNLPTLSELAGVDSSKFIRDDLQLDSNDGINTEDLLEKTNASNVTEAQQSLNRSYPDKTIEVLELNQASLVNIKNRPSQDGELREDFEHIDKVNSDHYLNQAVYKLSNLYGININSIDSRNSIFTSIPQAITAKAFVYNGEIYINTDVATVEDPIHELMHILLGSLKSNNPTMYYNAIQSIQTVPEYKAMTEQFVDRTDSDIAEEIFVQEVAKALSGRPSQIEHLTHEQKYQIERNVYYVLDSILDGDISTTQIPDVFQYPLKTIANIVQSKSMESTYHRNINLQASINHRKIQNYKSDLLKQGKLTKAENGYILEGHLFKSEQELDEFIQEKGRLYTKLGDLVFDKTQASSKAIERMKSVSEEASRMFVQGVPGYSKVITEDMIETLYKEPYYGVTRFLSETFPEVEELGKKRLFPQFIPDEYWSRRYKKWASGEFTDQEKEVFFDNDKAKEQQKVQLIQAEGRQQLVSKELRAQMEHKWKQQAAIGTAVHKIMQLYFGEFNKSEDIKLYRAKIDPALVSTDNIQKILSQAKVLNAKLEAQLGQWGELTYYTEQDIFSKIDPQVKGKPATLYGIIDLIVVDGRGKLHVIDYKTSTKKYADIGDPKKLAFTYQLAMYSKMLESYGFNMRDSYVQQIVPIQMLNFKKDGDKQWKDADGNVGQKWAYDELVMEDLQDLTNDILKKTYIYDNLQTILPTFTAYDVSTDKIKTRISEVFKQWLPNYGSKNLTDEEVRDILKEADAFKPTEDGQLIFKVKNSRMKPITVHIKKGNVKEAEEALFKKAKDFFASFPEKRANYTQQTINALNQALAHPEIKPDFIEGLYTEDSTGSVQHFSDMFERYIQNNTQWEILNSKHQDLESLTDLGAILLKNKVTQQIDVIILSTDMLHNRFYFKGANNKNMNMAGNFESDIKEQSKADSLMTMATYGNIELLKALLIINNLHSTFSTNGQAHIGRITALNPIMNMGNTMSNEELLYTYKKMLQVSPIEGDNIFQDGSPIRFAKRWQLFVNQFKELMEKESSKQYKSFQDTLPALEQANDDNEKLELLQDFMAKLKKERIHMDTNPEHQQKEEVRLYNAATLAYAELKKVKFRQQVEKYSGWLQSSKIWENGLNSLELDNPGHMSNQTLNLLAKLTMEMYQGTRDDMQQFKPEVVKQVNALKNALGFGTIRALTIGNQARDLYKNMFRDMEETGGNIVLKNPYDSNSSLQDAEREFLKFFLKEVNVDRYRGREAQMAKDIQNSDSEYYWLPLAKGDLASEKSATGDSIVEDLINSAHNFIKYLDPRYAYKQVKRYGVYINSRLNDNNSSRKKASDDEFFQMTNTFDRGNESLEDRINYIQHPLSHDQNNIRYDTGAEYFERNLETLLYKHKCAYITKEHVDSNTPLIKAALIHLTTMGSEQGTKYEKEIQYIRDYYKNKIKGESLGDGKWQLLNEYLSKLREAASLMTLGVAPVQFCYQLLDGLWKDVSLALRKPDVVDEYGETAFTFTNFTQAAKSAFSDLFHVGTPTIASLLNETYGLNDMDMNVYFDRIKSDKFGLYNWKSLAFWSASRPDFFNRLTIFGAQMRKDGTWDAHKIVDGQLVYDFTLDKRFSALQDSSKRNTQEYQRQLGQYLAIAEQFEKEGAKVYNKKTGKMELFKRPSISDINSGNIVALPKAYTNLDAESMKSLGDKLFGYYSHERKSMIHATTIGSLWMQYRTYWSGKKNQYLESGGIKLQGQWVQATDENGKNLFNYIKDGEMQTVSEDNIPAGVNAMPVFKWKGTWEEGIFLTVTRLMQEYNNSQGFLPAWEKLMSDKDFDRIYKSNLQQLLFDSTMFLIVGGIMENVGTRWLKQLGEDVDDSLLDALALNAANIAVRSLQNSFLDFNFFESIGQPGVSWDPFAFTYGIRQMENLYKFCSGDESFIEMLTKASGAARQNKTLWEWIDKNIVYGGDETAMPKWERRHRDQASDFTKFKHTITHPIDAAFDYAE